MRGWISTPACPSGRRAVVMHGQAEDGVGVPPNPHSRLGEPGHHHNPGNGRHKHLYQR